MAYINRRFFLTRSAAALAAGPILLRGVDAFAQKKYRACILGDTARGGYGHSLHLVWGLREEVEVVALADPDEGGRKKHASESGAARTYGDYREMLEKERPDLVAIGPRWTSRHREYLEACAGIGAHGMMEKPLTPDLADGDAAVAALESRNLKWAVAFNFRADPEIAHAKQLLFQERLIGDILEVRARGKEDHRSGGEDLIVLGIHLFDLMIYLMGPPRWCESEILVDNQPATAGDVHEATEELGPIVGDSIFAGFGFDAGIRGYFTSRKNPEKDSGRYGLDIYGSKGMATVRVNRTPKVAYLPEPSWAPYGREAGWQPLPDCPTLPLRSPESVSHYAPIVDDLILAIEENRRPAVSIQDALAATEMIQAIFESHTLGKRIAIPLTERSHPLKRWKA